MNKLVCIFFTVLVIECLSVSAAPQGANESPKKSEENEDDIIRERLGDVKSAEKVDDIINERLAAPISSENEDTIRERMGDSDATGAENGEDNTGLDEETMLGGNNPLIDPTNPVASAQSLMTNMRTFLQAIRRFDQVMEFFSRLTGISSS